MAYAALIVAVVSLFVAYLAVRRVAAVDRHLADLKDIVDRMKAEQAGSGARLETRLQELGLAARREAGDLKFLPSMTIAEAMAAHPGVAEVLAKFNLTGCSSCAVSDVDTLEGACRSYGIDERALMSALSHLIVPADTGDLLGMAQALAGSPQLIRRVRRKPSYC